MHITTLSALEAWQKAVEHVARNGEEIEHEGHSYLEVQNIIITCRTEIDAPIQTLRMNKQIIYPSIEEIEDAVTNQHAAYYYTYASRILSYAGNLDQMQSYILPLLEKDPLSRRAIMTLYNPSTDSKTDAKECPCLLSINFLNRNQELHVSAVIRSNEMLLGWPANLHQIRVLQLQACERLGLRPGAITTVSHSAHIKLSSKEILKKIF